jgi:hypothetical protein
MEPALELCALRTKLEFISCLECQLGELRTRHAVCLLHPTRDPEVMVLAGVWEVTS